MKDRWLLVLGLSAVALVGVAAFSCEPSQNPGSNEPVVHQVVSGPFVLEYSLVSKERVDRTRVRYTYRAVLENSGAAIRGASAMVSSNDPSTIVEDGTLTFSSLGAGQAGNSLDPFQLIQDRATPFDPASLSWQIEPWQATEDPTTGVTIPTTTGTEIVPLPTETSLVSGGPEVAIGIQHSEELGGIQVIRFPNATDLPLNDFIPSVWVLAADSQSTSTSVAGYPALRIESTQRSEVLTFIDTSEDMVLIRYGNFLGPSDPGAQYYDSFVSSFQP